MWSSWAESAKSSVTQALDKTGDIISKAATNAGKSARDKNHNHDSSISQNQHHVNEPTIVHLPPDPKGKSASSLVGVDSANFQDNAPTPSSNIQSNENQLLNNISQGWFNVIDATKATLKHAEDAIKEQKMMFEQNIIQSIKNNYHKRDVSLPLDVEALQDAEVVYITDRIITMGHPTMDSNVNPEIPGRRKMVAIAHLLDRRHSGHYMVWNLSEIDYDLELFNDQVLMYSFPGSPSPPLGLLLKLFLSMESWLKADPRNVAVVHCLTGKGRTSTVLAAFLCWMGEAQFHDVYHALEYIASCKQVPLDDLTIPSQRRYASYIKNMLDGVRPSQPPLMLKRIIMSEAPNFAKGPPRTNSDDINPQPTTVEDDSQLYGCMPYVQIFKAGTLLYTTAASLHVQQSNNEVPFCYIADGNISFHVNAVIQGDILIRARHLTPKMKRISMFRAAFHTGYAPPNVMRITKSQLDGACSDDRFTTDFFIDFIFEAIDAEEASKLLTNINVDATSDTSSNTEGSDGKKVNLRKAVQASAEDSMLYGDSRFWDVIANRMKANASHATAQNSDPLFGPTVGRRRDRKNTESQNTEMTLLDPLASRTSTTSEQRNITNSVLGAFSIGGEMDFLPAVIGSESTQMQNLDSSAPKSKKSIVGPSTGTQEPKKDSLLEALMGALDDDHGEDDNNDVETIEFDTDVADDTQCLTNIVQQSTDPGNGMTPTDRPVPQSHTTTPSNSGSTSISLPLGDDLQELMAEATLNLDTTSSNTLADDDMDALLSGATTSTTAATTDGLTDADLLNLDFDEAELDDLESFLSK